MAKAKTATPQSKVSKKDAKVKQAAVKAETKKKIVKVGRSVSLQRNIGSPVAARWLKFGHSGCRRRAAVAKRSLPQTRTMPQLR